MKRTLLVSMCIWICTTHFSFAQSTTGMQSGIGVDYSANGAERGKTFGMFGYTKQVINENAFIGISMSGRETAFRQLEDTVFFKKDLFILQLETGIAIKKETSKLFAGPAVGVGLGTCWDNFKISPGFPARFNVFLQLNLNIFPDWENGDQVYRFGLFARSMYYSYVFREENSPRDVTTNPNVGFLVGVRVAFGGDK